jgi:hypothetical protein
VAVGTVRDRGAVSNWVSLLFGALCATLRRRQALVLEHRLLRQPRAAALRARNRWGCTGAGPLADPAARLV